MKRLSPRAADGDMLLEKIGVVEAASLAEKPVAIAAKQAEDAFGNKFDRVCVLTASRVLLLQIPIVLRANASSESEMATQRRPIHQNRRRRSASLQSRTILSSTSAPCQRLVLGMETRPAWP